MYNEPIWDSISIICCGIGFFILTILILHFIFLIWIDLDNGDLLKGVNNGVSMGANTIMREA